MNRLVSFAGSGNVAWHLAPALDNVGYAVREVYSRNEKHAAGLVKRLYEAEVKTSLDFSSSASHIFFLTVSDDAIEEVVREIILPDNAIVVHTSGSQPLSRLGYAATPNIGVFYPVQIFSKNRKADFSEIPICIEAEDKTVERELKEMAKAISKHVHVMDARRRKALHVASVFASSFTNHMLGISKEIMRQNKLDFEWLRPLIAESLNKSLTVGPEHTQTGPAYLGDFELLDNHMEFLQNNPDLAQVYRVISQHIIDEYLKEE